jgi:hypothetical protein
MRIKDPEKAVSLARALLRSKSWGAQYRHEAHSPIDIYDRGSSCCIVFGSTTRREKESQQAMIEIEKSSGAASRAVFDAIELKDRAKVVAWRRRSIYLRPKSTVRLK